MSATERLKVWLNQKIANILGDLPEQDPVEDPSPTRAVCRIFFLVSLLLGFSSLLVYDFIDAPNIRVVEVYDVKRGGKNFAFPSCFLYDRNSTNCTKWSESKFPLGIPVSCPCTKTSFPWKNLVKFHVLHENSMDWEMEFTSVTLPGVATKQNHNQDFPYLGDFPTPKFPYDYPKVVLPDVDTTPLGNENIAKDAEPLTAEKFCELSYLWPSAVLYTSPDQLLYDAEKVAEYQTLYQHCVWMASLLFVTDPSYLDPTISTRSLNTPSLLNPEDLNMLLAKLARESVLTRRANLDMAYVGNENFRRFYNALAHLLTGLLDRDEMDLNESYVYGAQKLSDTLSSTRFYDKNAIVWYLRDHAGPIFLQPEIEWEAYREACSPQYCEVIKPMGELRKLYWALGILGGVATIVLAFVTTLLWPCTTTLLLWISKRKAAAMEMCRLWISKIARKWGTPQVAGPQPVAN